MPFKQPAVAQILDLDKIVSCPDPKQPNAKVLPLLNPSKSIAEPSSPIASLLPDKTPPPVRTLESPKSTVENYQGESEQEQNQHDSTNINSPFSPETSPTFPIPEQTHTTSSVPHPSSFQEGSEFTIMYIVTIMQFLMNFISEYS